MGTIEHSTRPDPRRQALPDFLIKLLPYRHSHLAAVGATKHHGGADDSFLAHHARATLAQLAADGNLSDLADGDGRALVFLHHNARDIGHVP